MRPGGALMAVLPAGSACSHTDPDVGIHKRSATREDLLPLRTIYNHRIDFTAADRLGVRSRIFISPAVEAGEGRTPFAVASLPRGLTYGRLTRRERQILGMVAIGYRNKRISGALQITVKTVEKHRSSIMAKVGLHMASQLTAYDIERGLVSSKVSSWDLSL